jgi:hypothetical protein
MINEKPLFVFIQLDGMEVIQYQVIAVNNVSMKKFNHNFREMYLQVTWSIAEAIPW